ncbi:hypothetical protein GNE08_08115 [Trichormus variabilis ARAD]|uniref:Uncharacterized protein n=1 Tax=Trichormus variabilis N2B TaxID=2681315 RepID=A0ABR6S5L9_ANAVA|nr:MULTISPECIES: hypothetical protein [Nostocaceae]MBC1214187.1 hypothetical protein [Trichormus variabilis ARAD]MBC1254824.1 hypothetical protein [Trichormus variabilis V5]MBC1265634.1 hypothetical protein [Trichormus variabilis FSR]MBC1301695.1 hypothetical protein [Trichormus variabilis N2B]MBC1309934.1 hypothetical protein [Trichormus variabilis PNB]
MVSSKLSTAISTRTKKRCDISTQLPCAVVREQAEADEGENDINGFLKVSY